MLFLLFVSTFSYEKSSRWGKIGLEDEFIRYLSNIQAEVERKIRRGHDRLLINQAREQVQKL